MKLREKLKRFWTLDVHNHEGFTLVELIIVIAILAILSTGAIAGYSVYIKQANMTADEALAAEIENALILAYYSGTLKDGASVVVYFGDKDVTVSADNGAHESMVSAFGENYASVLRLKWNGWKDKMGTAANATMMQAVKDSNFSADDPEALESLLSQVQSVVNAASGVLDSGNAYQITSDKLKQYLTSAGVSVDEYGNVPAGNGNAVANALVFFVADDIAAKQNTEGFSDTFAEAWSNYLLDMDGVTDGGVYYKSFEDIGMDPVAAAAAEHATVLALAKECDKNYGTTYADQLANSNMNSAERNAIRDQILAHNVDTDTTFVDTLTNDWLMNNSNAFLAYMSGVSESSDSLVKKEGLNKSNYFVDGTVQQYVTDYVKIGDTLIAGGAEDGAFVFFFNGETVSCLPLDY